MFVLLLGLALLSRHAGAQGTARPATGTAVVDTSAQPPAIIAAGFDAYRTGGLRAALAVWLKGSPVNTPAAVEQMVEAVGPIETVFGRATGHEVLGVVRFGTRVRRVYVVVLYEKGPAYAFFDCYRTGDGWTVPMFLLNTKPQDILPPAMITP